MKISMWSGFLFRESAEEALRTLAGCGYEYTEFSDEHGRELMARPAPAAVAKEVRSVADELGISIPQGHLYLGVDIADPDPTRLRRSLDYLKRELELYQVLGVKAAVLHCGGRTARRTGELSEAQIEAKTAASLAELCVSIAGSGIRIAIENVYNPAYNAADLLRIARLAGMPDELGICLDTGHLNIIGGDPVRFIDEAGGRLIALHITDNLGNDDHHIFPCGIGKIEWPRFMEKLRSTSYDGLFNYEVPGERCESRAILLLKLRYALELGRLMERLG